MSSVSNFTTQLNQLNQMEADFNNELSSHQKLDADKEQTRKTLMKNSLGTKGNSHSQKGSQSAVVLMLLATTTAIDDRNKVSCEKGEQLANLNPQIKSAEDRYNNLSNQFDALNTSAANGSINSNDLMSQQLTLRAQMLQEDQSSKELTTEGSLNAKDITTASAMNVELANTMKEMTKTVIGKQGNFKK